MKDFSEIFEKKLNEKRNFNNLENSAKLNGSEKLLEKIEVLERMQKIFDGLSENERNKELINAIKPLLSEKFQRKADDAIKIFEIFSFITLLKNKDVLK